MAGNRQRDPVLRAPLWPLPEFKRGDTRAQQRRWTEERRVREGANGAISTLQGLAVGDLKRTSSTVDFGIPRAWDAAGALARQISERARTLELRTVPHPHREAIEVASERLTQRRKQTSGRTGDQRVQPHKGELWPMEVEKIDLPPPGTTAIELTELCPQVAHLFQNIDRLMLDPSFETKGGDALKIFQDPVLEKPSERLLLAARMWRGGMLREVRRVESEVDLFTVVKKIIPRDAAAGGRAWDVSLRLIFDNRRGNLRWRTPPWVPLSGPGPLSMLDFSAYSQGDYRLSAGTGDVSNWYYRLRVPQQVAEYFVLRRVSSSELRQYLMEIYPDLQELPNPELGEHLGVCVLVMGWSWAVYLAHMCLTSIATGPAVGWPTERLLVHGSPMPIMDIQAGLNSLFWLYIDDFGSMSLDPHGQDSSALAHRDRLTARLRELGFEVHKEEEGEQVLGIGILLGGPFWEARPEPRAFGVLLEDTAAILQARRGSPKEVEALVGSWTWRMILSRCTLSCFDSVYSFARSPRPFDIVALPMSVLAELQAVSDLRSYMFTDWLSPLSPTAFMTDASPSGGAVVSTEASSAALASEIPWVTQGRWLLRHDWLAAFQQRAFEEVEEDPDRPGPDIAEYVAPLGSPRRPPAILLIRFCYLCSGPRRPGDVEDYFEQWAVVAGVLVIVDMLDLEVTPPIDLLDNSTQEEIRAKARTGWWHGGHGAPPCATWSAALFQPLPGGGGPRPYRTRDYLWGLPALSGTWAQRCLDGSRILVFVLEILTLIARSGSGSQPRSVSLEHPKDRGHAPFPSIWITKEVQQFEAASGCQRVFLDQCMFDAPS